MAIRDFCAYCGYSHNTEYEKWVCEKNYYKNEVIRVSKKITDLEKKVKESELNIKLETVNNEIEGILEKLKEKIQTYNETVQTLNEINSDKYKFLSKKYVNVNEFSEIPFKKEPSMQNNNIRTEQKSFDNYVELKNLATKIANPSGWLN